MIRFIQITTLLLLSISKYSYSLDKSPQGDVAIFDLGMASLACASVSDVNSEAIKGNSKLFFSDSVRLYSLFHGFELEKALKHQRSTYNILTGQPAVKAQSLNSITGAQNYVAKYLIKTDATNCNDIHPKANYILKKYGLQL